MVEHTGAAQGVQVAIGIEAQLARAVVAVGQLLAGVAERLEVADGVGILEHGDRVDGLVAILTNDPAACRALRCVDARTARAGMVRQPVAGVRQPGYFR